MGNPGARMTLAWSRRLRKRGPAPRVLRISRLQAMQRLGERPPSRVYPQRFKVLGNSQVAHSRGLEPIDEVSLANRLTEGET